MQVFIHIFMQIFMILYGGQLPQQICYSFNLLISYMVFNPNFKWQSCSFRLHLVFHFDGPNVFSQIQQSER